METLVYTTPSITPESVELYAYTNHHLLEGTPKAILLIFHGLNLFQLREEPSDLEKLAAGRGVLTIYPYYGPWCWMNRDSLRFVEDVVDAAIARSNLPDDIPVITLGGSMGGFSSLNYALYGKRTPKACFADCPVTDLPYHATERPDVPRTVYLAYAGYDYSLTEALLYHSPMHHIAELPRIPYHVLHGAADIKVNPALHSERFVEAMKAAGHQITYTKVPEMQHCRLNEFPEAQAEWWERIMSYCC